MQVVVSSGVSVVPADIVKREAKRVLGAYTDYQVLILEHFAQEEQMLLVAWLNLSSTEYQHYQTHYLMQHAVPHPPASDAKMPHGVPHPPTEPSSEGKGAWGSRGIVESPCPVQRRKSLPHPKLHDRKGQEVSLADFQDRGPPVHSVF